MRMEGQPGALQQLQQAQGGGLVQMPCPAAEHQSPPAQPISEATLDCGPQAPLSTTPEGEAHPSSTLSSDPEAPSPSSPAPQLAATSEAAPLSARTVHMHLKNAAQAQPPRRRAPCYPAVAEEPGQQQQQGGAAGRDMTLDGDVPVEPMTLKSATPVFDHAAWCAAEMAAGQAHSYAGGGGWLRGCGCIPM